MTIDCIVSFVLTVLLGTLAVITFLIAEAIKRGR